LSAAVAKWDIGRGVVDIGIRAGFAAAAHPRLAEGTELVAAQLGREVGSYASCGAALLDQAAVVGADGDANAATT
jgi:hypothetical protein